MASTGSTNSTGARRFSSTFDLCRIPKLGCLDLSLAYLLVVRRWSPTIAVASPFDRYVRSFIDSFWSLIGGYERLPTVA